jgi:hypothetical protein
MPIKSGYKVITSTRRTITLVFGLTLFLALAISYAPAADTQYLYCWTANLRTGSDQMFFSRVFPGDVSQRGPMQIAFQQYVNDTYQDSNPGPGACKNYSSRRDADSSLDLDVKDKERLRKTAGRRNWVGLLTVNHYSVETTASEATNPCVLWRQLRRSLLVDLDGQRVRK